MPLSRQRLEGVAGLQLMPSEAWRSFQSVCVFSDMTDVVVEDEMNISWQNAYIQVESEVTTRTIAPVKGR